MCVCVCVCVRVCVCERARACVCVCARTVGHHGVAGLPVRMQLRRAANRFIADTTYQRNAKHLPLRGAEWSVVGRTRGALRGQA